MRPGLAAVTLAAVTLAAVMAAAVSCAAVASPLVTGRSPAAPIASQLSLLHRVLIYAKEGSRRLRDGRWNLGQAQSKLGIALSPDETKQLMACTGEIVCDNRGRKIFASAVSVLRPDMLVTAKHVFSGGRRKSVSLRRCSFRSYLRRNAAIPIVIEQDQKKGFFLNNEDFIVARLERGLWGCNAFAIDEADTPLAEGDGLLSVTGYQRNTLNRLSRREPVVAKGRVRSLSSGFFGGPPFYYADIDLDVGGSGGAVFAAKNGRPVTNDEGQLVLRGLLVAVGPNGRNGKPYSEDQNYTIVIGLQSQFRDLVEGKARAPVAIEPARCPGGGEPAIAVVSEPVPQPPPDPYAAALTCSGKKGEANAACIAKELEKLSRELETVSTAPRGKKERQFKLKNDTSCPVCFNYDRCNEYGCWDETVRASGKSTLYAGVRKEAPTISDPQFCKSGRLFADLGPPLPLRKPAHGAFSAAELEAIFAAAKDKADREGLAALTAEDVRGLNLEQIRELRGY
jgi:hypothetical protein